MITGSNSGIGKTTVLGLAQSKLANILFTYELAKRLDGSGVTVNCLHPGVVSTNIWRSTTGIFSLLIKIISPFFLSLKKGAETPVYLASSPEVEGVTGKYFIKKKAVPSSKISYDETVRRRLWEVSETLTKTESPG